MAYTPQLFGVDADIIESLQHCYTSQHTCNTRMFKQISACPVYGPNAYVHTYRHALRNGYIHTHMDHK